MDSDTVKAIEKRVSELGEWFQNMDLQGVRTAPHHFLGDYPANQWRGPITLNSAATIDAKADSRLSLWKPIDGPGGFNKDGAGKLILGGIEFAAKGYLQPFKPEDVGYSSKNFWPGAMWPSHPSRLEPQRSKALSIRVNSSVPRPAFSRAMGRSRWSCGTRHAR